MDLRMKNAFIIVWRIACFAVIVALSGCASRPVLEQRFSHKLINHPTPMVESTAAKGDIAYLYYDYDNRIMYRLNEPLDFNTGLLSGQVNISTNTPLLMGAFGGKEVICSSVVTYVFKFMAGEYGTTCFSDPAKTGTFSQITISLPDRAFSKDIGRPIKYSSMEEVKPTGQPAKRELIFTGYTDGQLTFLYREYKNDLKIAAVNQPLFVSIESFPAKKEVKGLSIEFLSATDAQVSYKILAGFQP